MFRSGIAALIVAAGLFATGCAKDSMDGKSSKMDACPMCPGVQTATADGKCPGCNMSVKAMNDSSADVCTHCPGVQTMTADGMCSGCKMKVKPM